MQAGEAVTFDQAGVASWHAPSNRPVVYKLVSDGHHWELVIAERLRDEGLFVWPLQQEIDLGNYTKFRGETDILVGEFAPVAVESKSRNFSFSGPDDYPYDWIWLETVRKLRNAKRQPAFYVVVSQVTGIAFAIPTADRSAWRTREFKPGKAPRQPQLEAPKSCAISWDEMVRRLR